MDHFTGWMVFGYLMSWTNWLVRSTWIWSLSLPATSSTCCFSPCFSTLPIHWSMLSASGHKNFMGSNKVYVVYANPDRQRVITVDVDPNCTIESAILLSGILAEFPEIDLAIQKVGIFSKLRA